MDMAPSNINRLIGWMTIYPSFAKDLLDNDDTRLKAINEFQNPNKTNPMYGVEADPEGGHLSLKEIKTLMEIKAKTPEDFAKGCLEAGLGTLPGQPPESER
jgi:hypothetical protein